MSQSASTADVRSALDAGATVVTANNRLARALAAAFAGRMRMLGRVAWETPSIVPFDAFVLGMWRELEASAQRTLPRLLSSAEARAIIHAHGKSVTRKRREAGTVDQIAAAVILQRWLDARQSERRDS